MAISLDEKKVKVKAARSSGPGGQRANRRATKVQVWVKIENLPLTDAQKKLLRKNLPRHRLNHNDEVEAWCEEERSQSQNREHALRHLTDVINDTLRTNAPRIPTEVPRRVKRERVEDKKRHGFKKAFRRG